MSALALTVPGMIHPWRMLRDAEHVMLTWHDDGPMGRTTFATDTISLRRGLSWAERRCTVLHELVHLRRGPVPVTLAAKEEQRVRRETARLLLPCVRMLGDALAWAHHEHEAADELSVDIGVLRDRLRWLHPAERHYLHRRLEEA